MGQLPFHWTPSNDRQKPIAMSVSELGSRISAALAEGFPGSVCVQGEIGTFADRRGHWYLTLRDDKATISCVMWASDVRRCGVGVKAGDAVEVEGEVVHWSPQGRTQLRIRTIRPGGEGAWQAAFTRLCAELRGLGWFDDAAKKPLPRVPCRVAVVTSAAGAALHDVCATASERWPACRLLLVDAPVQGPRAAAGMSEALRRLDASSGPMEIDAVILTRGGGSAEDLQAFNDRGLAETIHHLKLPIVAAIGHESDTTVAELVADVRASTPTQAVMRLLPDQDEERVRLGLLADDLSQRMTRMMGRRSEHLAWAQDRLGAAVSARLASAFGVLTRRERALLARRPDAVLSRRRARLTRNADMLHRIGMARIAQARGRLDAADPEVAIRGQMARWAHALSSRAGVLEAIGPTAVMARGYSVTVGADGRLITRASEPLTGEDICTHVRDGVIHSRVIAPGTAGDEGQPDLPCDDA